MYYLTTYTYQEQLKHKRKLGFKYTSFEKLLLTIYAINIAYKFIQWVKSEEFQNLIKKYKENQNDNNRNI